MPFDPWVLLNIGDTLGRIGDAIMQPIYWAVSGLLMLFHQGFTLIPWLSAGWAWALAIMLLTAVVRLAMMPLYARQLNASRAMYAVQPKLQELQKKYGADRERLGQETMKLYQQEGVNPASSCTPLLIQMPIFLGLFWVLNGAATGNPKGSWLVDRPDLVESLRGANWLGAQLSGRFMPLSGGFGGTQIVALVLIVAMTALMFFQQLHMLRRNMPPSAMTGPMAQQQQIMLYVFPLMYAVGGISIPVGVLIYWLTSNVWTMAQQYFIIRNYPTPDTPAYVEWEERMRAQGKDPREIERQRVERGRRKPVAKPTPAVVDENNRPMVARQRTATRQTVRDVRDGEDAKKVVQRQQPMNVSRAKRKK